MITACPAPLQPGGSGAPAPIGEQPVSAEQLLAWRRGLLREGGRAADLDWLLDLAGGLGWQELQALRLHPDRPVTLERPMADLEALWRRHLRTCEPLQYLVGRCPWRDLDLRVAPGVLIPRQETELLVDLALDLAPVASNCGGPQHWADLGSGCGALAVALGRALPGSRGFAVEASPVAARQARTNLERAGLAQQVLLLEGTWWEPLAPWWGQLDVVVSNPPYIPSAVVDTLEPVVREHEPRAALDGGPDGLASVRAIVAGAPRALAPGGVLLLEHHHDQSEAVLDLLHRVGLQQVQAHPDLEGVRRFASGRRCATLTEL
ncbi:MAG: peptide chain release factor N(5)-glutamine methyltransferase [Synechococcaceae cyanobacterium]|nr:peptide chain release factor N(5)-glutamine methyltransferase [Synechococcaceae cyanobacterium]